MSWTLNQIAQQVGFDLVVLDIETSGQYEPFPGIIEFAAKIYSPDGGVSVIEQLLNPGQEISFYAQRVHGIRERDLIGKPTFQAIANDIQWMFESAVMVGYGIKSADVPVIKKNAIAYGVDLNASYKMLDLQRSWNRISGQNKGRLGEVAAHYGVACGRAHRAMGDVETTERLLCAMVEAHGLDVVVGVGQKPKKDKPIKRTYPAMRRGQL